MAWLYGFCSCFACLVILATERWSAVDNEYKFMPLLN